jgi:hypothetical protein
VKKYGHDCAEVDAVPPNERSLRVQRAIEEHIDPEKWEPLQLTEKLAQETLKRLMEN